MAQKVSIPWEDGSGDSFYIDYSGISGSSVSFITSDINLTGIERRRVVEFRTSTVVTTQEQASAYLTVMQRTDSLVVAMFSGIVAIIEDTKSGYRVNEVQTIK